MRLYLRRAALAATFALLSAYGHAAPTDGDEPALRAAVERAVWPGDIVRAADRYLERFGAVPGADAVAAERARAASTWQLVSRNDLRLYRSAFVAPEDQPLLREDLRRAALGDRAAVLRLAHANRATDDRAAALRYVGWLQYAAALGDDAAAYELALHFRRTDQPVLAAQYETVALNLGFRLPTSLDNVRK